MCLAVRKIHFFFKLKQDFLQTGRNILPIQIMNDSSDDTNIKVIQLSKSYLCFTSFSFINNLSGRNDFPRGILAWCGISRMCRLVPVSVFLTSKNAFEEKVWEVECPQNENWQNLSYLGAC